MKFLVLSVFFSLTFFSQGQVKFEKNGKLKSRESGGGSHEEIPDAIIKILVEREIEDLVDFFQRYPKAKDEFPEIDFQKFYELSKRVEIEVTTKSVYDEFGLERTAVMFRSEEKILFNQKKASIASKLPLVFKVLVFHELLEILEVEFNDPTKKDLALSYKSSGKLVFFVNRNDSFKLFFNEPKEPQDFKNCKISGYLADYVYGKFQANNTNRDLLTWNDSSFRLGERKSRKLKDDFIISALNERGYIWTPTKFSEKRVGDRKIRKARKSGYKLSDDLDLAVSVFITNYSYFEQEVFVTFHHFKSGFTKRFIWKDVLSETIIHPYNEDLLERIENANNANEYDRLKNQLRPQLNLITNGKTALDQMLISLPKCSQILGK